MAVLNIDMDDCEWTDLEEVRAEIVRYTSEMVQLVTGAKPWRADPVHELVSKIYETLTSVHDDLDKNWYSAVVQIEGQGQRQLFTTPEMRRVSCVYYHCGV